MKSKVKSVLLIVLMLISLVGIALTVNDARENKQDNHIVLNNQQMPPDMQGNGDNAAGSQPPSAPDDNFNPYEEKMTKDNRIISELKAISSAQLISL